MPTLPQQIFIAEFDYDLPESRIAMRPPAKRDSSKLLIYQNGKISENIFSEISEYLPAETLLIFNNSKVIRARLKFKKINGTVIEIFCLEPHGRITEYGTVMSAAGATEWNCLVGSAAKWKDETLEQEIYVVDERVILKARKIEKLSDSFLVGFSWQPGSFSFAEIIQAAGDMPLPPYIKRQTETGDAERYQTIFAAEEGSVAAPTAGLHFSENIFDRLLKKSIEQAFVTLHVGAGTFKPVKSESMAAHEMHAEYIDVHRDTIKKLVVKAGSIAAVGTTSLRTIESLYWLGIKAHLDPHIESLSLEQWEVYGSLASINLSIGESLTALLDWMDVKGADHIFTKTQILIAPGYRFRMANMLITNFHQPRSTLLLLVAAATRGDWKKIYDYALENDFRFLSYGDGSLIFIAGSGE